MDVIKTISQDEKGNYEVPPARISSASDARSLLSTLIDAEEIRAKKRARFQGMLNGNPPWPKLLRMEGGGERANFSLREAEGFMAAAKTPYYTLFFKAPRFIQVELEYGPAAATDILREWGRKIENRYQRALLEYKGLDMHAQRSQFQMIAYGMGPMIWEDDEDWQAKSRKSGQILLPDDASTDIDEWETMACLRSYLPSKLWFKIRNESAATKMGWNVEACRHEIMNAAAELFPTDSALAWEWWETEIRKNSFWFDGKSKRILVGDIFQKEFDGKITHMIIHRSTGGKPPEPVDENKEDDLSGFLFRKIGRYSSWREIICPFFYDASPDGEAHAIKGAGPKVFDYCMVSDRLTCRTLDGAMRASGILVRAKDANALQESAFTDVGGGTVIGPGYETIQHRVVPDMQSPLLAKRDLQSTLQSNTGQYRQRVSEENQEPTLGQAQLNVQQQNILGEGDASRYMIQADWFHQETLRRLLAMGKKLFSRTKDLAPSKNAHGDSYSESKRIALKFYKNLVTIDAVPEPILEYENFASIKATRVAGNGSSQMRQMIGAELMKIAPLVGERGKNFIYRNYISALADENVADAIVEPYGTPQIVDSHMSLAQLENNFLRQPGGRVMVDPSQNHTVHFQSHGKDVAEHSQGVMQGQTDPHELLLHMEQAGPHMHEHMQQMAGDPIRKKDLEQMQKQWLSMARATDHLAQQIQEQDAAAEKNQPQSGVAPELLKSIIQIYQDGQLKTMKAKGDMALKASKQAAQLRLKDLSTAHSIRLKNRTAAASTNGQMAAA